MNGSETILAIIAACAIIAAVLMAAFAYRLNEMWTEKEAKWIEIAEKQNEVLISTNCNCKKQNELTQRMGDEWLKIYHVLRRKEDGRD